VKSVEVLPTRLQRITTGGWKKEFKRGWKIYKRKNLAGKPNDGNNMRIGRPVAAERDWGVRGEGGLWG